MSKNGWTITSDAAVRPGGAAAWMKLDPAQLNLEHTLGCGQAFRWRRSSARPDGLSDVGASAEERPPQDRWTAIVRGRVMDLWWEGTLLYSSLYPPPFDASLVDRYLDLDLDLVSVCKEISIDEHVLAAVNGYPGLRILRQEPWETVISFILSQWSNVPRISKQIDLLSQSYGQQIAPGCWSFPTPRELARAGSADLRALGLGYRADYVRDAALQFMEKGVEWLESLENVEYREARNRLVIPPAVGRPGSEFPEASFGEKIHGVGTKVADCILLFSLGHYDAFPVDVHVRRAMERWYGHHGVFTGSYDSVGDFGRRRFGRCAGYAQQYLFHRQRSEG